MRKIEHEMGKAVKRRQTKTLGNTRVTFFGGVSSVYLLGNLIAEIYHDANMLRVNVDMLRRHPTPTTKSRLRALGANVTTRAGITYLNGEAI